MLRLKIFGFLVVLPFVFLFFSSHSDAQDGEWRKTCRYTESANYRPDQAVTVRDKQLLLVNATSGDVLTTLDSGFESFYTFNIFWTENCRYIVALNVWMPNDLYDRPVRFTSMYDTFTGQLISRWRREEFLEIRYSPTKEQFIMRRTDGTYLMSERMSTPVFLHRGGIPSMRQFLWDTNRAELLVTFRRNSGYVQVHDMWTGEQRALISNPPECKGPVDFSTTADGRYILVYGDAGQSLANACVTVYNRDDGSTRDVPTGDITATNRDAIALSPDGRYLVLGWNALRVWDLHTLSENFATREPIYRHEGPLLGIRRIMFVDNTTVETTSVEGVQRWNILTGEQIQDF